MAIIAKARAMRKAMTPAEARLWVALRPLRAEGFHFRRQHPLRGYYLDFVCIDRHLIVEVDGSSHADRREWDRRRDAAMSGLGFLTLRFTNESIRDHLEEVLGRILFELKRAVPTRSLRDHPPPEGEGNL